MDKFTGKLFLQDKHIAFCWEDEKGELFFFFLLGCVVNCFTGQFFDLKIDVLVYKVVGCGYFKFKYFNFFFLSFLEVLTLPTSTGVAKNALLNFRIDQLLN